MSSADWTDTDYAHYGMGAAEAMQDDLRRIERTLLQVERRIEALAVKRCDRWERDDLLLDLTTERLKVGDTLAVYKLPVYPPPG